MADKTKMRVVVGQFYWFIGWGRTASLTAGSQVERMMSGFETCECHSYCYERSETAAPTVMRGHEGLHVVLGDVAAFSFPPKGCETMGRWPVGTDTYRYMP